MLYRMDCGSCSLRGLTSLCMQPTSTVDSTGGCVLDGVKECSCWFMMLFDSALVSVVFGLWVVLQLWRVTFC